MTHDPKHFTIIDPRTLDGDPFEVADLAVAQLAALAALTREAVETAELMARNSELERQCQEGREKLDAVGWPDSPQGRRWNDVKNGLDLVNKNLKTLRQAARFNPKRPPKDVL